MEAGRRAMGSSKLSWTHGPNRRKDSGWILEGDGLEVEDWIGEICIQRSSLHHAETRWRLRESTHQGASPRLPDSHSERLWIGRLRGRRDGHRPPRSSGAALAARFALEGCWSRVPGLPKCWRRVNSRVRGESSRRSFGGEARGPNHLNFAPRRSPSTCQHRQLARARPRLVDRGSRFRGWALDFSVQRFVRRWPALRSRPLVHRSPRQAV